jgi:hypothetical protein
MTHTRFNALVAVGLAAVLVAACDRHDPVAPTGENSVVAKSGTSHDTSATTSPSTPAPAPGTPSDTATHPTVPPTHTAPPPDSGRSAYNGPVTVSGQVLLSQYVTPPAGTMGDTIQTSPVSGASITVVTAGQGITGAIVGQATTDANGSFTVANLTVGSYRLNVTPPAGSGLSTAFYQFTAQQASVSVVIRLSQLP